MKEFEITVASPPLKCPTCGTEYNAVLIPGQTKIELPCCGVTITEIWTDGVSTFPVKLYDPDWLNH